jgi:hypothetical protein
LYRLLLASLAPPHIFQRKEKVKSLKEKVWALRRASNFCIFTFTHCLLLVATLVPAMAGDLDVVREATRVLEEEVRLSARPQLYLLLDLPARALILKSHAMELLRLPIEELSVSDERGLGRQFILRSRPDVPRQKAVPGRDPTLEPIELRHMPMKFDLLFDPNLSVLVTPSWRERPGLWIGTLLLDWYRQRRYPNMIHLRLVLAPETAQSLAWSVLDGMPLLIKRAEPNS